MHNYSIAKALFHLSNFSNLEIYFAILASGHPLPIPEAVIFLALGFLAGEFPGHLINYLLVSTVAVITYDLVLYTLAYTGSKIASHFSNQIKNSWSEKYSSASKKKMLFLVFVSHFVPGWRMVNPVIAAGLKLPPKMFFPFTVISALIYPTIYIFIGFFLSRI